MLQNETQEILKFLASVTSNIEEQSKDTLAQKVVALVELSSIQMKQLDFLIDKIESLLNDLMEKQYQHENEMLASQTEIQYQKQIIVHLQETISDCQNEIKMLCEKIETLEDEVNKEKIENIEITEQLKCINAIQNYQEQCEIQQKLIEQIQSDIEQHKTRLKHQREYSGSLKNQNQSLIDKYESALNKSKELEQLNQKLTSEIAQVKQGIKQAAEIQDKHSSCSLTLKGNQLSQFKSQHLFKLPSNTALFINYSRNTQMKIPEEALRQSFTSFECARNSLNLDNLVVHEVQKSNSSNPYFDFFNLICQCAKLNNKQMYKILDIDTKHLYNQFIEANIPYHKWQRRVEQYLNQFL